MTRTGWVAVVTSAVFMVSAARVGLAATATPAPGAPPSEAQKSASAEANKEAAAPDDAANARNAARTRMRECGHQWSTMKKSGAANGLTWKDFSQGCLARK